MSNAGKYAAKVEKKSPVKKESFRRKYHRFRRVVRQNRYYQLGIGVLVCLVVSLASRGYQSHADKLKYTELMEKQRVEISTEYENKLEEQRASHEIEINGIRAEYENLTPEELLKQEGEYLARMLYAYRNNSERDLRTAVWCALNRVDGPGFPDTVKGVCQQPSQWMGYSDDNPILNNLYEIAIKELETWHSGYRPVGIEYVYMNWSSKQITLRDTYEKTDNTNYWQAG